MSRLKRLYWAAQDYWDLARAWSQVRKPLALAKAQGTVDAVWRARTELAMASADNRHIPRQDGAGTRQGPWLTMHNGIQVLGLGYYGRGMAHMLQRNRGVHEPQEERAFQEVLATLPESAAMMELGAYWGFYSLWFMQRRPKGRVFLVEPRAANLAVGRRNFERNRVHGRFLRGFIGARSGHGERGVRVYTVDELMAHFDLPFLDVLHADIQGAEQDMLEGATQLFSRRKVGYVFISTHSNALHARCLDFLRARDFRILASADLDDTYSVDGVIVARAPWYPGIDRVEISRRRFAGD